MIKSKQTAVAITGMSHDGRGIAHQNGKTIFIEGGLIGDEVEIEFIKRKNRFDEAKITQLVTAASNRITPACLHFTICGGCSLQHMNSESQILHKQSVLLEQLQHIGQVVPVKVLPAITAANYRYRTKARLGVRYVFKKSKLLIGFRERNGRYLADLESCVVLDPTIGTKIPLLRGFLMRLSNYQEIPQLEIAVGDDATAIIIRHLTPFSEQDLVTLQAFGAEHDFHLYLQPGGPQTAERLYPDGAEALRLRYRLEEYGIEFLFHPTDFTQVNRSINHELVRLAIELLAPQPDDILLDLFCGIGNFTLPFARLCQKVLAVEGCEAMVARGNENAAHNNIHNVEFICQNLADDNSHPTWLDSQITSIFIDPPRAGALEILQQLTKTTATRIVYVSCNPATLARDAGFLCEQGFALDSVGVLDMFPHTNHVESIALFTRE